MKKILLYQVTTEKGKQIERICLPFGIMCLHVLPADYLQPLGAVAGLPGMMRRAVPPFAPALADEMAVFSGFTSQEVFRLLAQFRSARLAFPALKAVLTPSNAGWDALALQRELKEEAGRMK